MLNAADHQMERPTAVQISWVSGCTESTRAVCRAAEQALGECLWLLRRESFVSRRYRWDMDSSLGHEAKAGPAQMKGAGT